VTDLATGAGKCGVDLQVTTLRQTFEIEEADLIGAGYCGLAPATA
jgi:hypothetical protein